LLLGNNSHICSSEIAVSKNRINNMNISIIIPIYNVGPYIKDCLHSVLNQTCKKLEIVIVNDQTMDNSMEIVNQVLNERKTPFQVKIVNHDVNRGLSAARNTGIEHSSGDYLFFLDSDDEITPNCIESLSEKAQSEEADIIIGDYSVAGSNSFFPPLKLGSRSLKRKREIIRSYMKESIYVMAWNKLIKKDFVLAHNLFFREGLIHEDCLWSFQCICQAETITILKEKTYIYKVRENSIKSGTAVQKSINALKIVLKEMVEYAEKYSLLNNRYVYSFIEQEKLRLLYTYQAYKLDNMDAVFELYSFFRSLSKPSLSRIFWWNLFHTTKSVRDAHYFLVLVDGSKYYHELPSLLRKYSHVSNMPHFYTRYIRIIFSYILTSRISRKVRGLESPEVIES